MKQFATTLQAIDKTDGNLKTFVVVANNFPYLNIKN